MDRILIILQKKKMAQGLHVFNTIIFKYVYWYMKQISGERLQDHWSSGLEMLKGYLQSTNYYFVYKLMHICTAHFGWHAYEGCKKGTYKLFKQTNARLYCTSLVVCL